ncbi:MAG: alpha-glucosidase C-terminal domain-containing protein [Armatimonadota bacterium]
MRSVSSWGWVYQFPLPPLVLHTLSTGDASALTAWASELEPPSDQTTFYNFLASHDGVGVRPVEGILTPKDVQAMVDRTLARGGHASYKTNADGSESVYELNISYFDAVSDPAGGEPLAVQVARFLASQSIMLTLQGVPAIYAHSFFGSRNYPEGVAETGRYRSINREKLRRDELEAALADPASLRARVYTAYHHLLTVRQAQRAFHPNGPQQVLDLGPALFAVVRTAPEGGVPVVCVHNVTDAPQETAVDLAALELPTGAWEDLVGGERLEAVGGLLSLALEPYQIVWLSLGRPT